MARAIRITSIGAMEALGIPEREKDHPQRADYLKAIQEFYELAWGGGEAELNERHQICAQYQFQLVHGYGGPQVRWSPDNDQMAFSINDLKIDQDSKKGTFENLVYVLNQHQGLRNVQNKVKTYCDFLLKAILEAFFVFQVSLFRTRKQLVRVNEELVETKWSDGVETSLLLKWIKQSKRTFGSSHFKASVKRARKATCDFWSQAVKRSRSMNKDTPGVPEPPGPPEIPGQGKVIKT